MHPDRNPNADQDKFKELTSAYNWLSNKKKRKEYDQYREAASYGGGPNSSNYNSNQNPYGQNYNPYGKGGHYQQKYGQNNNHQKYEYKSYKSPEDVKKEFEEFFRKATGNFRQGGNQRQGQNSQKFNNFSKSFWESYEKQRQRYFNFLNSIRQQQHRQGQNNQYKDPRQEFYEKYRQQGVPVIILSSNIKYSQQEFFLLNS